MTIEQGAKTAAAILCGALAVCQAIAVTPAFAQATSYDGTYLGTQTLSDHPPTPNYAKCLTGPFKRQLVVKDGAVTYTYNRTYQGQVTGMVTADGDVNATSPEANGGVALTGKITGDDFTGEVWSFICTYSLQLKRVP